MEKINIFILHPEERLAKNMVTYFPTQIADCTISKFKDGEISFENHTSIRNGKCFILQTIHGNVNDRLMEVLIAIDALKRASAGEINVVMPYLCYTRQDRKARPRQPISARLVADMLEKAGADRLVTLDLHAPQVEGFYSIPVDNISIIPLFYRFLEEKKRITEHMVVVASDHGGAVRARKMAEKIGCPVAIIDKRREKANEVKSMRIIGDVTDKDCLLVDDIVDTGETLCKAATLLKECGATTVFACCTHAVLSEHAVQNIQKAPFDAFYVTNSLEKSYTLGEEHILDIAKCLAQTIHSIVQGDAVTEMIENFTL